MRTFAYTAPLVAATVLAGCGGGGDRGSAEWPGPPAPAANGVVAVDGFVDYATKVDAAWERSAATTAAEFVRLDRRTAARTRIDGRASAEGTGPESVTVTLDGLLDDSIRAERWTLAFTPENGTFRLTDARRAQRCRPGRGHTAFSAEPCV